MTTITTANQHYITLYYTVDGEPFDQAMSMEHDGRYIDGHWSDYAAQECAKDYFHNHDGWERRDWSDGIAFTLWRDADTLVGAFEVVMEMTPSFTAYGDA